MKAAEKKCRVLWQQIVVSFEAGNIVNLKVTENIKL